MRYKKEQFMSTPLPKNHIKSTLLPPYSNGADK